METLDLLKTTQQETLSYFELSEKDLAKSYGPGKWTIRQILHHLADAETVLYDRVRRVISEPKQVIWAFDQDLWSRHLDYENLPLEISKGIYTAVRNAVIYQANRNYHGAEKKEFIHSETGLRTLKDEFDKIALHNRSHLIQIKKALKNPAIS